MVERTLAFLLGVVSSSACGGSATGETSTEHMTDAGEMAGDSADQTSPESSTKEASSGCMPTATPSELASTPRADVNLELLALKLSGGRIVADQVIYDRVVRDVGAIRSGHPEVASIGYFPPHDGRTIDISPSQMTFEQMQRGDYHDWDCLNAAYGASMPFDFVSSFGTFFLVGIKLRGIYAIKPLAADYAKLPGITNVEPGGSSGDGSTICVTPSPTTWHYVFDAAGGDCPAGCTEHHDWHFTTEADGAVTPLENWNSQDGIAAPAWVATYASRSVCR